MGGCVWKGKRARQYALRPRSPADHLRAERPSTQDKFVKKRFANNNVINTFFNKYYNKYVYISLYFCPSRIEWGM